MGIVNQEVALTRDITREEQMQDRLCDQYRHQDGFWTDEENLLYRQGLQNQSCIVIPTSLVPAVLNSYHELPFTAHQGVGRTVEFIKLSIGGRLLQLMYENTYGNVMLVRGEKLETELMLL